VIVIVMVMVQAVYLLNCRPRTRSALSAGLFSNRWMLAGIVATWLAQILFTYLPFMNAFFTAPRCAAKHGSTSWPSASSHSQSSSLWLRFRANRPMQPSRI
jgi:magnesium-transporting ATPase (P-type)